LSLLTLGVTSRDRTAENVLGGQGNTAVQSAAYIVGEALFNAAGLDRQVQKFLPKNPVLRDLSFRLSTNYNDATSQLEPMMLLESKFVWEELKLEMMYPMRTSRGRKYQAEYRLHDRFSAQAQLEEVQDASTENNLPNFGLEFKVRWEVD
jgi:translocation and assembly module TamB